MGREVRVSSNDSTSSAWVPIAVSGTAITLSNLLVDWGDVSLLEHLTISSDGGEVTHHLDRDVEVRYVRGPTGAYSSAGGAAPLVPDASGFGFRLGAGGGVTKRFDPAGQLIEIVRPDGSRIDLSFDNTGRLVVVSARLPDPAGGERSFVWTSVP